MNKTNFQKKIVSAAKWSTLTEVVAKLITPITSMILARILAPEAFGVVATITMIVSFADMFKDAGFQKYLIQHEFKNDDEKFKSANVAFLTNFFLSFIIWVLISLFSEQLASLVGNPGLGIVIIIACLQLPLTAFSSIQLSLYQRNFDFKTLFLVRIVTIFIPIIVTIPLALIGLSYWSIIIGNLIMQISNAIILTVKSEWKPNFYYNFKVLKDMFSFSMWSLIESISIWLTTWIDTFIIASLLSQHHVGVYKTSTTLVNALMAVITASIVPVMFSTLSRLQNNDEEFINTFFDFQRIVSIIIFPLGIGVYVFRDFATQIMLGEQWSEASNIIGTWALTSAIVVVLSYFCSEVYRAKGRPKLSFLAQLLHLVVLIPTIIISSKFGFWVLIYARSWIRLQGTLVHFIILKFILKFPIHKSLSNVIHTAISSVLMGIFGFYLLQLSDGLLWNVFCIFICIVIYLGMLYLFPYYRNKMKILGRKMLLIILNKCSN